MKLKRDITVKKRIEKYIKNFSEMGRLNQKLKAAKIMAGIPAIEKDEKYEKGVIQDDVIADLSEKIKKITVPIEWEEDKKKHSATVNISRAEEISAEDVFVDMDTKTFVSIASISEKSLKEIGFSQDKIDSYKKFKGFKITVAAKKTREIEIEY